MERGYEYLGVCLLQKLISKAHTTFLSRTHMGLHVAGNKKRRKAY